MGQRCDSPREDEQGTLPTFRFRRSLPDESEQERLRLQQVIGRAKEGNKDALHDLYERYADNVFSYVRTILRDDHEAEDVTQQVFTKLLVRVGSYEERAVPFTAWLLRIARNAAIDQVRSRRTICCEEVPSVETPGYDETASDRRQVIEDALSSLPDGQRQVVVMRHMIGLSPREIATQMGKSEGAIHTLHHRARRGLKKELVRRGAAPVVAATGPAA